MHRFLLPALAGALLTAIVLFAAPRILGPGRGPVFPVASPQSEEEGPAAAMEAAFTRSLEGMRSDLEGLRDELRALRAVLAEATGAGSGPDAASPATRAAARDAGARAPMTIGRTGRAAENDVEKETRLERLQSLRGWQEDATLRKQWLFLPEEEALLWFGMPDDVSGGDDSEIWYYMIPETNEEGETYLKKWCLSFHEGRLISFIEYGCG